MGAAYPGCARRAPTQQAQLLDRWPRLTRRLLRQPHIVATWGRLLRKQLRLRRLQRLWPNLGMHFQDFPRSLRTRLSAVLPKQ